MTHQSNQKKSKGSFFHLPLSALGIGFIALISFFWMLSFWIQDDVFQLAQVRSVENRKATTPNTTEKMPALFFQTAQIALRNGDHISAQWGSEFSPLAEDQLLAPNTSVIITKSDDAWVVVDVWRLQPLAVLVVVFFILVVLLASWQGLSAFVSMLGTVVLIGLVLIPSILAGYDPFLVSLAVGGVITVFSLYLSHGISLRTHLAVVSMLLVMMFVAFLAYGSVATLQLFGRGNEEALFLQSLPTAHIALRGLLLGGITLGALGVLDDIVVSQIAAVFELRLAKPSMSVRETMQRSLTIGHSHVVSLVNTLVLAYAGANLPLFLLFYTDNTKPWWVVLNSEIIMEELIRTLAGSIGLVVAVPVATFLAAWGSIWIPQLLAESRETAHSHVH